MILCVSVHEWARWGWQKDHASRHPLWTNVFEASESCNGLIRCGQVCDGRTIVVYSHVHAQELSHKAHYLQYTIILKLNNI